MKNRNVDVELVIKDQVGRLELSLQGSIITERFWAGSGVLNQGSLENVEAVADALKRFVADECERLEIQLPRSGTKARDIDENGDDTGNDP